MSIERLELPKRLDEDRIAIIRDLFPEIFSDGKLVASALQEVLGELTEDHENIGEHYGLMWPGKRQAKRMAVLPPTGTLAPVHGVGVNEDTTKNIFIEGDNLEVLRIIQKGYIGRIKMIYVDPPYNTGKDFIYKDDFSESVDSYLRRTGQSDDTGLLTSNPKASGRFHSNWLTMMYPRFRLAWNLLADEGVIFVSISDAELQNLRRLLDDIFGEENFIASFVWVNEGNIDNQSKVKTNHEYIVMYAKKEASFAAPPVIDPNIPNDSKLYNPSIENTIIKNGPANPVSDIVVQTGFPVSFEEGVIEPNASSTFWPKLSCSVRVKNFRTCNPVIVSSGWAAKDLCVSFIKNGFNPVKDTKGQTTEFYFTESGAIYNRKHRSADQSHVLTVLRGLGTVQSASAKLAELEIPFDYPKPVELISYLIQVSGARSGYVLDFFAGSGTTGEAIFKLQKEGKTDLGFILVQLPEKVSLNSQAVSEGFGTISDLCQARLTRSAEKLYRTSGADIDTGFRVLKLSKSNIKRWRDVSEPNIEAVENSLFDMNSPIVEGANSASVITEIMLVEGYPLDATLINCEGLSNNLVVISHSEIPHELCICLDDELKQPLISYLSKLDRDAIFVCLDSALTDQSKIALSDSIKIKTL